MIHIIPYWSILADLCPYSPWPSLCCRLWHIHQYDLQTQLLFSRTQPDCYDQTGLGLHELLVRARACWLFGETWWNCNYQTCHDGHRKIIQIPHFAWHLLWGAHVRKVALCKSVFDNLHPRILFVSWSSLRDPWHMNRVKSASSIETGKPEEALETQRPQTPPTPLPSVQLPSYPPVESHDDQASSRRPHTGFFPAKRQARVLGRAGSRMLPHRVSPREDNSIAKGSKRYLKKSGTVF